MHIKAVTLADITTLNGKRITFDAWNVISSNNLRSKYDWPRSPPNLPNRPTNFTEQQKDIWRNALHKTFGVPHSGNRCKDIQEAYQLGRWTDDSLIEKWIYHYSIEESRVYKKEGLAWKAYYQIPGPNTRNRRYEIVEN